MLSIVRRFRLVTSALMTVVIVLTTQTVWMSGPQESAPATRADCLFSKVSIWKSKENRDSYAARSISTPIDLGRENMFEAPQLNDC